MQIVKKHIRRVLPKSWEKLLIDPRRHIHRWGFEELIDAVMKAMLSGCKNLRELELLTAASGERIPDTTMRDLLVQIDPSPLEEEIAKGVKQAARSHELDEKELPFNLIVIDGKALTTCDYEVDEYSRNCSQKGVTKYVTMGLRAFYASSPVKLLMGQELINQGTNDRGAFGCFLDKLVRLYGRTNLLEVISIDAGITSIKNAKQIVEHNLDYIMALKDARSRKATRLAIEFLGQRKRADKIEKEFINGRQVIRRLYRCETPEMKGWEHATEFWRINKETINKNGTVAYEDRYFITSIPKQTLTNSHILKAIRLHWSIENNANWVIDTAWGEDTNPWCNQAIELLSLMRIIAYNVIARLKLRRLKHLDKTVITWKGVLMLTRLTLFPTVKTSIAFS